MKAQCKPRLIGAAYSLVKKICRTGWVFNMIKYLFVCFLLIFYRWFICISHLLSIRCFLGVTWVKYPLPLPDSLAKDISFANTRLYNPVLYQGTAKPGNVQVIVCTLVLWNVYETKYPFSDAQLEQNVSKTFKCELSTAQICMLLSGIHYDRLV